MTDFISSKTSAITKEIIQYLMSKVWEGVAAKNVVEMVPLVIRQQHQYTVQSFVYQNHAEKFRMMGKLAFQKDPTPAKMDTIAAGNLIVKHKQKKGEKSVQQGFIGDRTLSLLSDAQIKSVRSNQVSVKNNKKATSERQIPLKKESFFISLGYQEEKQEQIYEKMRDIQNIKDQQQKKLKRESDEKSIQKKKLGQVNQKLLKQKNLYTFNYQGDLQEISYGKLNDSLQRMKEKVGNSNIKSKQKRAVESTKIENQRNNHKQQRQHSKLKSECPQFSFKTLSITQALQDISKVAEGVKITDLKNGKEGVTLEHKAKKLDGLRQYRLNDFKNIAKEKSFVQFSHSSSKKKDLLDYSASEQGFANDSKIKTTLIERSNQRTRGQSQRTMKLKETQEILQKALGRGLPFIRTKGLRFHDLGHTNTFQTLEANSTAKRSSKSKSNRIRIGDSSLYEQNFFF